MKKNLLWIVALIVWVAACTSEKPLELADYQAVTTVFTKKEVADLQAMLGLFEKEIGIQPNASPEAIAAGYDALNRQVAGWYENGNARNYPLSDEKVFNILDTLQMGTFRSIWSIGVSTYPNGDKRPDIGIHTSGKFMNFLNALGKEYPQFTTLQDELRMAGDISPSIAVKLSLEMEQANFRDARVRLVYTIIWLRGEWKN